MGKTSTIHVNELPADDDDPEMAAYEQVPYQTLPQIQIQEGFRRSIRPLGRRAPFMNNVDLRAELDVAFHNKAKRKFGGRNLDAFSEYDYLHRGA